MKKILTLAINLVWILVVQPSWAGELVFGPQKFTRLTGKPQKEVVTFQIPNSNGRYLVQVRSGEAVPKPGAEPGIVQSQHVVSSAVIVINGMQVAGPQDFSQKLFGFQKEITLNSNNILEVEVRGVPESFITLQIREAEPNPTVSNKAVDLSGLNMGDQIVLWWTIDDRATEYILFRSTSVDGPWVERFRMDDIAAATGGGKVDITPDARLLDLCYRVEAINALGQIVRTYEPICVPKFVETQTQSFRPEGHSPNKRSASLSPGLGGMEPLQRSASLPVPKNSVTAATVAMNNLCVSDSALTESSVFGVWPDY